MPIIEWVASSAGVEPAGLVQHRRVDPHLLRARAVAMYLARELTDASWPDIGAAFRRHHTTIMAAHRRVAGGPLRAVAAEVAAQAGIVLP